MKSEAFVSHLHNTIIQQIENVALFIHYFQNYAEFQINLLTIIVRCDENFTICHILFVCFHALFFLLLSTLSATTFFRKGGFFLYGKIIGKVTDS